MGHKVFAKCCAFLSADKAVHPILLSGGGDSTVRFALPKQQSKPVLHDVAQLDSLLFNTLLMHAL